MFSQRVEGRATYILGALPKHVPSSPVLCLTDSSCLGPPNLQSLSPQLIETALLSLDFPTLCCKPWKASSSKFGWWLVSSLIFQWSRKWSVLSVVQCNVETMVKGKLGSNYSAVIGSGSPAPLIAENSLEHRANKFWQRKRYIRGSLMGSRVSFWLGKWSLMSDRSWFKRKICIVMTLGKMIHY